MKTLLLAIFCCFSLQNFSQTCYTLGPRNNGNGQSASCGSPNCSGNAKTGHFDVVFSSLPSPLPTMQLISVSTPPIPSPFCFDPGSLQSGTTVRYCFRGSNLPNSGTMVIRFTQGATSWSCSYNTDGSGGTILPVRLIGFDAKIQSGSVLLKWSTASEENNDRFVIERSDESQQFQAIGTVSGVGNSTTTQYYSYTDRAPLKGINFYRLRQVDADDKFSFSQVKRVDNRLTGLHIDPPQGNEPRHPTNYRVQYFR